MKQSLKNILFLKVFYFYDINLQKAVFYLHFQNEKNVWHVEK